MKELAIKIHAQVESIIESQHRKNIGQPFTSPLVLASILVILLFSLAVRGAWLSDYAGSVEYTWNDEVLLTTNDAYHYATSTKIAVDGNIHGNPNLIHDKVLAPNGAIIATAAMLSKVFGLSVDTAALYTPMLFAGVSGVLVFLILHVLGYSAAGLLAGLLTTSAKIYFIRTRVGYFDTDIFTLTVPLALITFGILLLRDERFTYALIAALLLIIQKFFYINNPLLSESILILFFMYVAIFRYRSIPSVASILLFLPTMLAFEIPISIEVGMVLGIFYWVTHNHLEIEKLRKITLIAAIAVLPLSNLAEYGWDKFSYFSNPGAQSEATAIAFSYTNVAETVDEIQKADISKLADLSIGGTVWGVISLIGLGLLILHRSAAILLAAMLALGLTSIWSGERFTIYAVPALSIGLAYALYFLSKMSGQKLPKLLQQINNKKLSSASPNIIRYSIYGLGALVSLIPIYQNTSFALSYDAPPILTTDEAAVLDALGKNSSPLDKVIAWWDYGYEIHYFAGRQTIASGAAAPEQLFALSTIFSSPEQKISHAMTNALSEAGAGKIDRHMRTNVTTGQGLFNDLGKLSSEETHGKALYIPSRMIDIFPTVYSMSPYAKDILTGQRNPYTLYIAQNAQKTGDAWTLDGSISIDLTSGEMKSPQGVTIIKSYIELSAANGEKPKSNKVNYENAQSNIHLLFLPEYKKILLLDDNVLNSAFIQMFFFENFDENQFSLRIRNNFAKVFVTK
jgi:asparagine N-glycosylation enzyme membrane subunit Stt3